MDQLIPTLATLVEPLRGCFHPQVFQTFQALLAGWIVCQGPRTISEVWLATGLAAKRHHDTAYAVFHSAVWEWDDLGIVLATLVLAHLVPGGVVWIVVDDTLCHKRGAKVGYGNDSRQSGPLSSQFPHNDAAGWFAFCRTLYPQGRRRARPQPRPGRPCGCNRGGRSRDWHGLCFNVD
jgi:hypothetical protein